MFQQRHFEAIAALMQDVRTQANQNPLELGALADYVQNQFCNLFARENGRFNRDRFERACIPGANVRARTR